MRRQPALAATFVAACALSACGMLPAQVPQPQLHDLGPLPAPEGISGALRVDQVSAPAWIDDGAIHYRLVYRDPTALRSYADHRWAAPPSELLRLRLQSLLGGGSAAGASVPVRLLSVEVLEFEQDFSSPQQASVRLAAQVSLHSLDGQLLGTKRVVLSGASTPDVQGAIGDLSRLAEQAAEQITRWCERTEEPGKSGAG